MLMSGGIKLVSAIYCSSPTWKTEYGRFAGEGEAPSLCVQIPEYMYVWFYVCVVDFEVRHECVIKFSNLFQYCYADQVECQAMAVW